MTLAITANIILIAIVFSGILGMLAWAIHSSRPERQARLARPVTSHATRARSARSRAYGSYERLNA